MKKTVLCFCVCLFSISSINAQVESIVNDAISEFKAYGDPSVQSVEINITSQERSWEDQLMIILDPRFSDSYTNIKNRFLSYAVLTSLPSYTEVSENWDWMNWWESNIMDQAGQPNGFPHVGGRAVDVSVWSLNTQQKENFARILENKGVNIIFEYYGGSSSDFHVSIESANLFHCFY